MGTRSSESLAASQSRPAWEALTAAVEELRAGWRDGKPPQLADLLPDGPTELRRLVLVELVKVDLECRWQDAANRKNVRDYVAEFPELDDGDGIPCDLLYEERRIRQQAGEDASLADYQTEYPQQAEELARLFQTSPVSASTILSSHRPTQKIAVGESIDDFDLLTSLGEGAFGQVFLARQRSMQRLVALKVSSNEGDEPQTLAQLDHPFIVRVFDQRELPDQKTRLLYMQFVPGGTLHRLVQLRRAKPAHAMNGGDLLTVVDEALADAGHAAPGGSSTRAYLAGAGWAEVVAWIGVRLASALDYAHTREVMHRDIKPANVLLDAEGSPKLADFNISYCSKVEGASPAAFFGGSLPYMSPEQLEVCSPRRRRQATQIDERSDLYSLGVLLWELLTGRLPHGEERVEGNWSATLESMLQQRAGDPPVAEDASLPADCPPGLVDVLRRCLAPHPDDRWSNGAEFARQLSLCLSPEIRALLDVRRDPRRRFLLRHPYFAVLAAAVIPNALAGGFNYDYNVREVVDYLAAPAQRAFWNVQLVVNTVAFGVGILLIPIVIHSIVRWFVPRSVFEDPPPPSARRRCLRLGIIAVVIGIVEWLLAGIVFPVSIHSISGKLPGANLPAFYLTFIASMTVCGLIAAAYPFFGVTLLSTRVFYPAMLQDGIPTEEDLGELRRLGRLAQVFLGVAALVPMAGVALVTLVTSGNRLALAILSVGGAVGFFLAFWWYRRLQRTIELLVQAGSMGDAPGSSVTAESTRWKT